MDVQSIVGVFLKQVQGWGPDGALSSPVPFNFDKNEIDRLLAKLPSAPDEKLR
jgi:hypothetical protein